MILTLALCAVLCACVLFWILAPAHRDKGFYAITFAAALFSLGVYLAYGRPDLPAASINVGKGAEADYRQMLMDEFSMVDRLSKNPDDADAMIRLAALRLAQGRGGDETLRLLAKAETLAPDDKRIAKIRKFLER